VTGPKAGLVRRKKLVKGKIGNKLRGKKTFQKLRDDRKVRDWAIGDGIRRQPTRFF
jgi:hypothetical protein